MFKRQTWKKRYLGLANMEIRNALSKLRMYFFKTCYCDWEWFKTKRKKEYANFVINMKLKLRLISLFNVKNLRNFRRVWLIISSLMIINCFCGMVDRGKAFSLISSRDHCQRSWPSRIFDTPRAGFESAQNQSSGLV